MEDLAETEIGSSVESFQKFLDSQRELFHNQTDHLQRIIVTQCKLTGVNPLSQEMAAGALSIKTGKRLRDLINPKAVKYMQEVFSIKDAFSKKESGEISVQFGATLTQVIFPFLFKFGFVRNPYIAFHCSRMYLHESRDTCSDIDFLYAICPCLILTYFLSCIVHI